MINKKYTSYLRWCFEELDWKMIDPLMGIICHTVCRTITGRKSDIHNHGDYLPGADAGSYGVDSYYQKTQKRNH